MNIILASISFIIILVFSGLPFHVSVNKGFLIFDVTHVLAFI